MRKNLLFVALAAAGLASCNGGYKKASNGMLYNIFIDKAGTKPQAGDFLLVNLVVKNDADSVLFSTYDQGRPTPLFLPKPTFKGDVFDGMTLLAEGDSASVKVSADSIFKKSPKPPTFKGKSVIYNIKIEKLIPKGKATDQIFQSTVNTFMMQENMQLKKDEPININKYIADKKLAISKTDSGLYYSITQKGSGPNIANGDTAVVNYTGKLLTGKVFDSNIKADAAKANLPGGMRAYTPIKVPIGEKKVIPGWDQGLLLLNKGAKATFVIPSKLAYGEQGNQMIGPFTPLVFDLELVDIIHPNPNAAKPAVAAPAKK